MSDKSPPAPGAASLLRLAAPLVVSFWMRAAVTFVDTIYASFVGDAAVASIGLTVPLEFLMIAIWVGLSTGLTSGLSRAMGAGEGAQIDQYREACWRLVAIVTPVFTLVGGAVWIIAPRLGLEAATAEAFQVYGTVLICGSALTTFWSIIPDSLVKAHHDTRSTMWAGIWSNLINVALNTLFIFVFEWGVFGIALSTVLGRIGGLSYAIWRARHHELRRVRLEATPGRRLDPHPYRSILALAVPSSITFALFALESAWVNGLLARMEHATETIAAYAIYYRVVLFGLQPVIATSVAMLPYAARRFGEGDIAGIRRGFRQAMSLSSGYAVAVVGPTILLGGPWLATWLAETELTRRYTEVALWATPLSCLVGSPFLICRPVFEAMNRGRPGLVMAALRYLILTGPLAWLGMWVARNAGQEPLYGLIVGLLAAAGISSLVFYVWLRTELRRAATEYGSAP